MSNNNNNNYIMRTSKNRQIIKRKYSKKNVNKSINLGNLFSKILINNNIDVFFGVPSDLNMPILDAMLKEPVKFIGCRNELNASYMCDGYSRTKPFSILVVGSMVGSLSASNGFANSICEKNPVLMISGGNNSNDELDSKLSHHTLFQSNQDQLKSYEIFSVLCGQDNTFQIISLNRTHIINTINNISRSLIDFNSAYLQIPANFQKINGIYDCSHILSFKNINNNFEQYKFYNIINEIIEKHFNNDYNTLSKLKPVFLFGSAYNHYSKFINLTDDNFYELMNKIAAVMFYTIDAKGILDENNKNVLGYYWGGITDQNKLNYFEKSKALIYIGVELNDYNTSGYTCLFNPQYAINCKNNSNTNFSNDKKNKIKLSKTSKIISSCISKNLNSHTDIFVETGSSWFYGSELKLPPGCRFNISIRYASIGWCFPASIGNSFANPSRKTICLTGDGAFQMVLQELATAQKYNINLTLILINNNVYQIENVLDKEEYNNLPIFDYQEVAKGMGCKNVATCTIDNFNEILNKYNSMIGFNMIILEISDNIIDTVMEDWAKLVSKYTTHY